MSFKGHGKEVVRSTILLGLLLLVGGGSAVAEKTVYNRYNIHVQDQLDRRGNHRYSASYANYTNPGSGHLIIPPGTALVVKKASRKGIVWQNLKDNSQIEFEYHEQRMGMSVEKYLELITSPEPVSLKKFSKQDRQGIDQGKAAEGMTREGVLAALGYPATHRTPSLESNTWIYWTNRFATLAVEFNDQGKVVNIRH